MCFTGGGVSELARALIRFNLAAAVPSEAIIDQAWLDLVLESGYIETPGDGPGEGPPSINLIAALLTEDWIEALVTWNNRPATGLPEEATAVEEGTLASNAMMEYNIYDDGWVVVSMVDSAGMNGDGSLVVVTFDVVGEADDMTCTLMLENLKAWDATNVFEIHTEASTGTFAIKDRSFIAPVIIFAP